MLKETSSQMLDSYRASSSELLAKIREMVVAKSEVKLEEVEPGNEVNAGRKGKEGKKKGKGKKGKMKEYFTDEDDENENGEDEDYGTIKTKIIRKVNKKIKNHFIVKENNGITVGEENPEGVDKQKYKRNPEKNVGRKFMKQENIYVQDIPFKLSENWVSANNVALILVKELHNS